MLKGKIKCDKLTKNNILLRATLRGLKKCNSCGYINGQRAQICRNIKCDLRLKKLAAIKPFDAIELTTYGQTKLFSLRSKEKLLQPRNFVSITEYLEPMESQLRAVCYEDNCKYDAFEPNYLACRHIKACKVLTNVPQAEIYPIDKSILWNLNIPIKRKQHLWNLYQLEEKLIHPVQKINSSMFVVKCVESKNFPAGRLHVTVFSNKVFNKCGTFSCSCKKLKIVLEPDNSVTMKQEICDHMLLLLAAVINKPEGKTLYGKFLDSLQYLWMPTSLNTPIVDCDTTNTQFLDLDLSLERCNKSNIKVEKVEISDNSVDIFNFTEELFAENNIPDFSDIVLEVNNDKISKIQKKCKSEQMTKLEKFIKDPKLNATTTSINDDDMELNFPHLNLAESLTSAPVIKKRTPTEFNENGLTVIEQFQLNNNMQVSNDNIELAKDIENLNNLESQVVEKNFNNLQDQVLQTNHLLPSCTLKQKSLLKTSNHSVSTEDFTTKPCIYSTNKSTKLPVAKSVVFNRGSVKVLTFATTIKHVPVEKNGEITKIEPKNITELQSNQDGDSIKQNKDKFNVIQPTDPLPSNVENKQTTSVLMPSISYESWLDHLIEIVNESITIQDSASIKNSFHVPEAIFNHFSKTFTLNNKRRLPTNTTVIKSGKYKEHIKNTWYMNQASTVQRIFRSKNMKIELNRSFQRFADGSYELYTPTTITLTNNNNFRPIYPKVKLYKAFIQFINNEEFCSNSLQLHQSGIKLEWLPSAFPKSNFGLMTIEFCVSVEEPDGTM